MLTENGIPLSGDLSDTFKRGANRWFIFDRFPLKSINKHIIQINVF